MKIMLPHLAAELQPASQECSERGEGMEGERRLHPEPQTAPQEGDAEAGRRLHEQQQQQQREGGEGGGRGFLDP